MKFFLKQQKKIIKIIFFWEIPRIALLGRPQGYAPTGSLLAECCCVGCREGCNLWLYPFL